LRAGASNTVVLSSGSPSSNISLDEIVVSRPDELAAAQSHRQVLALAAADRAAVLAYLRQLDGAPAGGPAPSATPTPTASPVTPTPTSAAGRVPLGGRVRDLGGAALPGATIELRGAVDDAQATDAGGDYVFRDLPPGDYAVAARRTGGDLVAGADALAALRVSVGQQSLTGGRAVACDVTGDGRITALDAARILQRVGGRLARFAVALACDSDWLLVPAAGGVPPVIAGGQCTPGSLTFPALAAPVTDADFVAVAFGDCAP
jgi:hypothetical protein